MKKHCEEKHQNDLGMNCEANYKQCIYTRPKDSISSEAKKVSISLLVYYSAVAILPRHFGVSFSWLQMLYSYD